MEYRVVYLAVVKAYSQDNPEIIVLSRATKAGAQVTFCRSLGEEFFGEVLSCIPTGENSPLHQWIIAAAGNNVRIDPKVIGPGLD